MTKPMDHFMAFNAGKLGEKKKTVRGKEQETEKAPVGQR